MGEILAKVKNFFSRVWAKISKFDPITVGIWGVFVIVLVSFLIIRHRNQNEHDENQSVDLAQGLHPSIGDALSPDTPTPPKAEPEPVRVAPHTGVDPNEPVAYVSDELKFSATLPVGTQITEHSDGATFTTKTGALYYTVSTVNSGTETLQSIEAELRNSPSVSNISKTSVLKFNAKNYGQGMVILANKKIYYLLGDSKFFPTFKTF